MTSLVDETAFGIVAVGAGTTPSFWKGIALAALVVLASAGLYVD
jgi:hypothetical protein